LPISTTHATIGAILGIDLFLGGILFLTRIQFVMWAKKKEKEAFLKMVLMILA